MHSKKMTLPVVISIVAALLYNDWPLGFLLNPKVAPIGLSSDLESYGQPFNWLFISSDIASATLIFCAVWLLAAQRHAPERLYMWALSGLSIFGLMTVASAILPLHCAQFLRSCGFNPGQVLGIHDITSALGALGMFIGMAATLVLVRGITRQYQWSAVLLIAWSFWGLLFILTPFPVVRHLPHVQVAGIIWEQVFLVISGIAVVYMVYCLDGLTRHNDVS